MGSLRGDKGRKSPEMLCKTPIVFDDEYSAMNIPNRATANETRSPNYNGTPFSLGISLQVTNFDIWQITICATFNF